MLSDFAVFADIQFKGRANPVHDLAE